MTVRGTIQQGRVVLTEPVPLADGTEVEVDLRRLAPAADGTNGSATVLDELKDLAGTVEGPPARHRREPRPLPVRDAEEVKEVFADTFFYPALFSRDPPARAGARKPVHSRSSP